MAPSRNKHNRNFAGQTKTEGGRPPTLTLNLRIRHFGEKALELLLQISLAIPWDYVEKTQQIFGRSNKGTRRKTRNPNPRLRTTPFQREGGRAIIGDFPADPMGLSRNKHNTYFPGPTMAQGGRLVTLTLDLVLRHFIGKSVELLMEISQAIPWD